MKPGYYVGTQVAGGWLFQHEVNESEKVAIERAMASGQSSVYIAKITPIAVTVRTELDIKRLA